MEMRILLRRLQFWSQTRKSSSEAERCPRVTATPWKENNETLGSKESHHGNLSLISYTEGSVLDSMPGLNTEDS